MALTKKFNFFYKLGDWFNGFSGRGFATSFIFGSENVVWIETNKPFLLYESIPQLKTVINRKAKMFSNLQFTLTDKTTGKPITDDKLFALLNNPNPLQSMNDWLEQYKIQEQVYGNQFIYKLKPSNLQDYPSCLYNISPRYMKINLTGKMFQQTELSGIIKNFELNMPEQQQTPFALDTILYSKINDLDNPVIGTSIIGSLKMPLTNTELAYKYRNTIMSKRGALGMLTRDGKDTTGGLNLDAQKKDIDEQYRRTFGINEGQAKIIVSEAALKWQAMSYPTKDLMLFEEIDENTLAIIDAFGMNANIFSTKNSTYENVKQSLISVYQDTIIPEADKFTMALEKFLKLPPNYKLQASYGHIEILKQNTNYNDIYPLTNILTNSIQTGIMTPQQAQLILENELGKYFSVDGVFGNQQNN